jgi:Na+/proline symporter
MILPAINGRNLLPDLVAQNRTADAYVLLVMRLLPAGMVGIIMAAMFSATMATVSADFNAIASVLTKDVYQRLLRAAASERTLLAAGRWITLALGAITTVLSLWIALTHQQSLFSTMVTVLGLFMAPTLLPLLAGLTVRRLNWQGALAGFLGGLGTGFVMLALKTWWPGARTAFGSIHNFEGVSLLANTAATILGMAAGTVIFRASPAEIARVDGFFASLDDPIRPEEAPARGANPAGPVLAISTIAVGLLIAVAGVISGSSTARAVDLAVGLVLVSFGLFSRRRFAGQSKKCEILAQSRR